MKWHVINSIVRKKCGRSLWCILLIQLILIMHPLLCQVLEEGKLTDEDLARQGLTKMSFKPPVLTEEEDTLHGSKFLTDDLQCDGCLAIAYQFHESLQQRQAKRPKSLGPLPQSELIDITEETCDPRKQRFDGYGLTTGKDGSHRLTGPGLAKSSGVAHMGGKTPTRLVDSCNMLLEADETAIYEAWVRGNKMPDGIKEYLCKNPNRKNVPESVSEDLDLAICLKDGIKHVADEL